MTSSNLYGILGVPDNATADEIKSAYRLAARRFHPDANPDPGAAEEFKLIAGAYTLLSDPAKRTQYDQSLARRGAVSLLSAQCTLSREALAISPEPQILYALLDINPAYTDSGQLSLPGMNLCLVIDRSTSMQGARLDQVKGAVLEVIDNLRDFDVFSVVAYSDKAQVVVPAQTAGERTVPKAKVSTLNAGGGTEILEGLLCGLLELGKHAQKSAINHLILLTDGRTYGDEEDCLLLATLAATDGIVITGMGIGDEWNDTFLDELTGTTGGTCLYINSPQQARKAFLDQIRGLGATYADRLMLTVIPDPGIKLLSAFRLGQEVGPVPVESPPLRLGAVEKQHSSSLLLRFQVPGMLEEGTQLVARLGLQAEIVSAERRRERLTLDLSLPVKAKVAPSKPPTAIVTALGRLSQYQLQERAFQDASAGNISRATERLSTLGTRLLAAGQVDLARATLAEARRLEQTQLISEEAKKNIKYGTRALMLSRDPQK